MSHTRADEIREAVAESWLFFYNNKQLPTRKAIVDRVKSQYPHLDHAQLGLEIAHRLNYLVDAGILRRVTSQPGCRHYAPGEKYYKE